jgi:hypothetical protein
MLAQPLEVVNPQFTTAPSRIRSFALDMACLLGSVCRTQAARVVTSMPTQQEPARTQLIRRHKGAKQ